MRRPSSGCRRSRRRSRSTCAGRCRRDVPGRRPARGAGREPDSTERVEFAVGDLPRGLARLRLWSPDCGQQICSKRACSVSVGIDIAYAFLRSHQRGDIGERVEVFAICFVCLERYPEGFLEEHDQLQRRDRIEDAARDQWRPVRSTHPGSHRAGTSAGCNCLTWAWIASDIISFSVAVCAENRRSSVRVVPGKAIGDESMAERVRMLVPLGQADSRPRSSS